MGKKRTLAIILLLCVLGGLIACGRKEKEVEIVKKLHSLNTPIEKIAEIVNISTEVVKQIIK